ncbi:TIGR03086 family metal-binding protein [Nonomuraea sp. M3C6]|uniref:TIGR03086 family metal-binding protein n=1 Tax=Nonomuraea marmarensis TaxID=3351344 RepID=A0ABW7AUP8_9ACTN
MPVIDLEPAAREVVRLLDGVTEDRLDDPTPCADTPVAALLDHFMGLSLAFTWAARKTTPPQDGPGPGAASAGHLDPQWRTLLPRRLGELVEAWRDPIAWEGMTEAGGVTMPAGQMAMVALDELVLHGWDLARATGQPYMCNPADTAAVLAFTSASARPEQAAGREGLFGPVVEVPEDASAFDRALGFAGRDPAWTPKSA